MKTQQPSNPAHTPTPWIALPLNPYILGPDEEGIALVNSRKRSSGENTANAAFIVRAVNAHEALLAFAKLVSHNCLLAPEWKREADKAIAKAEGK